MACCQAHCLGAQKVFDSRTARRDLKHFRKKGPSRTTRWLLEAIQQYNSCDSLLDIGGGIGAIQHTLAAAGFRQIVNVDASPAYQQMARQEAAQRGYIDRVQYLTGDFVALAPTLPQADVVTLDRVICCYPDMRSLVSSSVAKARKLYGVVFPRDNFFTRLGARLLNFFLWLSRNPFRTYIHPSTEFHQLVQHHGLEQVYFRRSLIWQVRLYQRRETVEK